MKLTTLFREFFENERASGLVLIMCTMISLLMANSIWSADYLHVWHAKLGGQSVEYWINDGLMTIFFLLIGLELEREVYQGELSRLKDALLPVFGALGGMLVPAGFYFMLNAGTHTQSGIGIPMATDIAFAIGVLSLLGSRVPASLKVFLTALAVIDDLGAILVIAIFYTTSLSWVSLGIALGIFSLLIVLNRLKVHFLPIYLVAGVCMWYFMLNSGVHATITGVLLAFAIPFGDGSPKSISYKLQHWLHKPVSFIILPLFALANTAIVVQSGLGDVIMQHYSQGIALGLVIGKPLGIFLFSFLVVSLGWCVKPKEISWKSLFGAGCLGGIGFTMSIFITLLAFDDAAVIDNAKLTILLSSTVAGIIGFILLQTFLKRS